MIAMVLAAGRGTRLQPLTDSIPKALVPLEGRPLLYYILRRLHSQNITEVVINVHHFPDQIVQYLQSDVFSDMKIHISDESSQLLDTGGAIHHAQHLFGNHREVLIHNVDVICDIDLQRMMKEHKSSGAMVTMAVRNRRSSRYLLFGENHQLCGWHNTTTNEYLWADKPEQDVCNLAFSGIHIFEREALASPPGADHFSIIPHYLKLASHKPIKSYLHDSDFWRDLGRPSDLEDITAWFATKDGKCWKEKYLDGWSPS